MSNKNFKAEVYSRIFEDAKNAKPIKNMPNVYTPDEYNKVRAQSLLLGMVDDGEYLEAKIPVGAVELNPDGSLKAIARNRPAMLDLNMYTRNRYEVQEVIPANEKKVGLERGTYIVVLIGNPIVRAIADTVELPKTVRAFRFKKTEIEVDADDVYTENEEGEQVPITDPSALPQVDENGKEITERIKSGEKVKTTFWKYVGAEMIPSERAYKMTRSLDVESMMELLPQIEAKMIVADGEIVRDSLNEIG